MDRKSVFGLALAVGVDRTVSSKQAYRRVISTQAGVTPRRTDVLHRDR